MCDFAHRNCVLETIHMFQTDSVMDLGLGTWTRTEIYTTEASLAI